MLLMSATIHVNAPDFLAVNTQLRPVKGGTMLAQVTRQCGWTFKYMDITAIFLPSEITYIYYYSH